MGVGRAYSSRVLATDSVSASRESGVRAGGALPSAPPLADGLMKVCLTRVVLLCSSCSTATGVLSDAHRRPLRASASIHNRGLDAMDPKANERCSYHHAAVTVRRLACRSARRSQTRCSGWIR
jgi:hypothetical protein